MSRYLKFSVILLALGLSLAPSRTNASCSTLVTETPLQRLINDYNNTFVDIGITNDEIKHFISVQRSIGERETISASFTVLGELNKYNKALADAVRNLIHVELSRKFKEAYAGANHYVDYRDFAVSRFLDPNLTEAQKIRNKLQEDLEFELEMLPEIKRLKTQRMEFFEDYTNWVAFGHGDDFYEAFLAGKAGIRRTWKDYDGTSPREPPGIYEFKIEAPFILKELQAAEDARKRLNRVPYVNKLFTSAGVLTLRAIEAIKLLEVERDQSYEDALIDWIKKIFRIELTPTQAQDLIFYSHTIGKNLTPPLLKEHEAPVDFSGAGRYVRTIDFRGVGARNTQLLMEANLGINKGLKHVMNEALKGWDLATEELQERHKDETNGTLEDYVDAVIGFRGDDGSMKLHTLSPSDKHFTSELTRRAQSKDPDGVRIGGMAANQPFLTHSQTQAWLDPMEKLEKSVRKKLFNADTIDLSERMAFVLDIDQSGPVPGVRLWAGLDLKNGKITKTQKNKFEKAFSDSVAELNQENKFPVTLTDLHMRWVFSK